MRRFTSEGERPRCQNCGIVIRWDAKWGFCGTSAECRRLAAHAYRRSRGEPTRLLTIRAGDTFTRWTVLEDYANNLAPLMCRCECGTERLVGISSLTTGNSTSCGCSRRKPMKRSAPYIAAGETFTRLTALEDARISTDKIRFRCECGTETTTTARLVRNGRTVSCGCKRRTNWLKHGLSQHPLVHTWYQVSYRTSDPEHIAWANYGGRGIRLAAEWQGMPDGFRNFANWIAANLGARPEGYTLDRIDNDGNYEPGNVRWATRQQQLGNRRTIKSLTGQRDALLSLLSEDPLLAARAHEIINS